jgi:hypothetical protein
MSEESYIRGAGATRVDGRRVGWVLAAVVVAGLAVATVAMFLVTASDRSRADRLRQHGVPVQATVTHCAGISSGIGMGVEYYECRATYTLAGDTAEAVLHGSRSQLPTGRVVDAVAVPGDPGSLSVPGAGGGGGGWTGPIVLAVLTVLGVLGLVGAWRRARR